MSCYTYPLTDASNSLYPAKDHYNTDGECNSDRTANHYPHDAAGAHVGGVTL